jgi:hypothetical protein
MPDPAHPSWLDEVTGQANAGAGLPAAPSGNDARSLLSQIVGPDAQAQAADRARQRRAAEVAANRRALESMRRGDETTRQLATQMRQRGQLERGADRIAREEVAIPGTGVTYSPGAMLSGVNDVLTLGHADEVGAGVDTALHGGDYRERRDEIRRNEARLREENPGSYMLGAAAGIPMSAAMLPSAGTAGLSRAGAVGARALEGGIYGGLAASGASNRELGEDGRLEEGLRGIATGGAFGAGMEALGQTVSQLMAARRAAQSRAPDPVRAEERARLQEAIDNEDPLFAEGIESLPDARRLLATDRARRASETGQENMRRLEAMHGGVRQRLGEVEAERNALLSRKTMPGAPYSEGPERLRELGQQREAAMEALDVARLPDGQRAAMPEADEGLIDRLLSAPERTSADTARRVFGGATAPVRPRGTLPTWALQDDDDGR